MSPTVFIILGVAASLCVMFVFMGIWLSRYAKVSPNQALVVSGRMIHKPDGTVVGYRIVKGGGTFVWPVFETVNVLSLEAIAVELPKTKVRTPKDGPVEADCTAQVKIKGDDTSLAAAAEHFLGKNAADIGSVVKPILEKHLRAACDGLSRDEISRTQDALAEKLGGAASVELGTMGIGVISFTIQDVRNA